MIKSILLKKVVSLSEFLKSFNNLIKYKFIFNLPKKNNFLIYQDQSKENLEKFLKINFECLKSDKEVNIIIFFLSLIIKPYRSLYLNYIYNYIKYVNPKFFFTFQDNDDRFYLLKDKFSSIKFISIQGGYRNLKGDFFDKNLRYEKNLKMKCDYIFVMNDKFGKEYKKIINTKTVSIGSFLSNSFPMFKKKIFYKKKTLIFISQVYSINKSNKYFINSPELKVSRAEFYEKQFKLIKNIYKYCQKNDLDFKVLTKKGDLYEKEFFKKILKSEKSILIKKFRGEGYKFVDKADLVVGIDSTLVYETLSRGKKIGIFSIREQFLKKNYSMYCGFNFGWPYNFSNKGSFWSNNYDSFEVARILDYLIKIKKHTWKKIINNNRVKEIMIYNPHNTILKNELKLIMGENA